MVTALYDLFLSNFFVELIYFSTELKMQAKGENDVYVYAIIFIVI